jgi:hypothetical protein
MKKKKKTKVSKYKGKKVFSGESDWWRLCLDRP